MKESFLHLVWQQKLFKKHGLLTVDNKTVEIENYGTLNNLSGPDISSAVINIDGQKWAGNVEIHVKSSDWYAHQHQKDKNYNNVILHVVFDHDVEVYDLNGNEIPVLEFKKIIDEDYISNYKTLLENKSKWIFCETFFKDIDKFKFKHWLERLFIERLERKTNDIAKIYNKCNNDWEATLFLMMVKYFGGNINGDVLCRIFTNIDYSIIRKQFVNGTSSAFIYGVVGLLDDEIEDSYYKKLQMEFHFQKQKYQLDELSVGKLNFYGCRPNNFPTIRLAQLIAFYETHLSVFSKIIKMDNNIDQYKKIFEISVHSYWLKHYSFNKESRTSSRKISKDFRELIIINVIIPILFLYNKNNGVDSAYLLDLMYELPSEKNGLIQKFQQIGYKSNSALDSQALLTLKKEYCDKERCAECYVGIKKIRQI